MPSPLLSDFKVSAFVIPTDSAESDGTLAWDSTTLLLVELSAGGKWGLGYTYAHASFTGYATDLVRGHLLGKPALDTPARHADVVHAVRNLGEPGVSAMVISAIDNALWDLKGKLLGASVSTLIGRARDSVDAYGSGGFTSYTNAQMEGQLAAWADLGIRRFKIKVGTDWKIDPERVRFARKCIGVEPDLFIDANGAYDTQTALRMAYVFHEQDVTWFEQPIEPSDFAGMRYLRSRLPAGMNLATGEYIYTPSQLKHRLETLSEDFVQLDVTRCRGITGFLKAAAVCEVYNLPISSHCAPALHVALGCALPGFRHLEYFHDHERIERMLFDGVPEVRGGTLAPDDSRPGLGLEFKRGDAEKFRAH